MAYFEQVGKNTNVKMEYELFAYENNKWIKKIAIISKWNSNFIALIAFYVWNAQWFHYTCMLLQLSNASQILKRERRRKIELRR